MPGPQLELYGRGPDTLSITIWNGFPDDISVESLSLTLMAAFTVDEGVEATKRSDSPILRLGKNVISCSIPSQKPGRHVLGVLTGQIGSLRFRSHSFSRGSYTDSTDFMSFEKPTRLVLKLKVNIGMPRISIFPDIFFHGILRTHSCLLRKKVHKLRPLVDILAAVSSALLMNELQWVGLIIKSLNHSLKDAILHIKLLTLILVYELKNHR